MIGEEDLVQVLDTENRAVIEITNRLFRFRVRGGREGRGAVIGFRGAQAASLHFRAACLKTRFLRAQRHSKIGLRLRGREGAGTLSPLAGINGTQRRFHRDD